MEIFVAYVSSMMCMLTKYVRWYVAHAWMILLSTKVVVMMPVRMHTSVRTSVFILIGHTP